MKVLIAQNATNKSKEQLRQELSEAEARVVANGDEVVSQIYTHNIPFIKRVIEGDVKHRDMIPFTLLLEIAARDADKVYFVDNWMEGICGPLGLKVCSEYNIPTQKDGE